MKQCEICIHKPYKDKLLCCASGELINAFRELLREIPFFGRFVKPFECGSRIVDERYTGFTGDKPVNCKCVIDFSESEKEAE